VSQPWRATAFAWNVFKTAILTIPLRFLAEALDRFIAHIERANPQSRPHQIDEFLELLHPIDSG
jgi:hypothetical protein